MVKQGIREEVVPTPGETSKRKRAIKEGSNKVHPVMSRPQKENSQRAGYTPREKVQQGNVVGGQERPVLDQRAPMGI